MNPTTASPIPRTRSLAVAARHGRLLREDDLLAPDPLRRLLQRTGWWLALYDDPDRFVAVAERVSRSQAVEWPVRAQR